MLNIWELRYFWFHYSKPCVWILPTKTHSPTKCAVRPVPPPHPLPIVCICVSGQICWLIWFFNMKYENKLHAIWISEITFSMTTTTSTSTDTSARLIPSNLILYFVMECDFSITFDICFCEKTNFQHWLKGVIVAQLFHMKFLFTQNDDAKNWWVQNLSFTKCEAHNLVE